MMRILLLALVFSWSCDGIGNVLSAADRCRLLVARVDAGTLGIDSLHAAISDADGADSIAHRLIDSVLLRAPDGNLSPYTEVEQLRFRALALARLSRNPSSNKPSLGRIVRVLMEIEALLAMEASENATDATSREHAERLLGTVIEHYLALRRAYPGSKTFSPDDAGALDSVVMKSFVALHGLQGGRTTEGTFSLDGVSYPFVNVLPDSQTELGRVAEKMAKRNPPVSVRLSLKLQRKRGAEGNSLIDTETALVFVSLEDAMHTPENLRELTNVFGTVRKVKTGSSPLDIEWVTKEEVRDAQSPSYPLPTVLLDELKGPLQRASEKATPEARNDFVNTALAKISALHLALGRTRAGSSNDELWIARLDRILGSIRVEPEVHLPASSSTYTVELLSFPGIGKVTNIVTKFHDGPSNPITVGLTVTEDGKQFVTLTSAAGAFVRLPVKDSEMKKYFDALAPLAIGATNGQRKALNAADREQLWSLLVAAKRRLEVHQGLSSQVLAYADQATKTLERYRADPNAENYEAVVALAHNAPTVSAERSTLRPTTTSEGRASTSVAPEFATKALRFQSERLKTAKDSDRTTLLGELGVHALIAYAQKAGWYFRDRSNDNVGYDVELTNPRTGRVLRIEVKARGQGGETFTVTRAEIAAAQKNPDDSLIALVEVGDDGELKLHLRKFQPAPLDVFETRRTYGVEGVLTLAPQSLAALK